MERKDFLRNTLGFLGIGIVAVNCGKTSDTPASTGTDSTGTSSGSSSSSSGDCVVTDSETAGPYPTKTPSSLERSDITDGQAGVPLTVKITIKNANNNCAVLSNTVVDIWHCTSVGYYSEYVVNSGGGYTSVDGTSQHYLRGRQTTDSNGLVTFISIFPGWYSSRAPHIHVHIYNSAGTSLLVTQIAFPTDVCNTVYTTASDYKAHGTQDTANTADSVFKDSLSDELTTVTGSVSAGYTLTHTITVDA